MSPTISCSSVYKIFGDNAQKLLSESKGEVDAAKFQEAGCIVGVNDASFEGKQRRNACSYGLFRLR
jgi:glycine betaine/proline transport system ATP-binding protein